MTPADRARASAAAQGLPATVQDPAILRRVAALLVETRGAQPAQKAA